MDPAITHRTSANMNKSPIAIITGAGSGIGRAIAIRLAGLDWTVIVNDLDEGSAAETSDYIHKQGGLAVVIAADIGHPDAVKKLFARIKSDHEHSPQLLVNNAAVQTWATLEELSVENWQKTINTNLTGCFLMTKSFAKIAERGSSIINIGSGCNQLAFPALIDYTASKGGIEMLTKSTALELGPRGIRVNCIAPGAIETERTSTETNDYSGNWASLTPLQRIGTPDDIADALSLLIDDKASFITGQTLNVDGGLFSRAIWPDKY